MLEAERSGFFDPRRRGTVIEKQSNIVVDLAIRLLALGRERDAFAAFESVRARGLSELALAMARPDVSADDRQWLADLLAIEAQESAIERKIVAEIVASGQLDAPADQLEGLDRLRAERQAKLKANETARARFDVGDSALAGTLDALRAATAGAGVPVLLYWTTRVNIIAWYFGPDGSDVREVFLPESVLKEKVRDVTTSSGGSFGEKPFDETTARELFLYLLGPFSGRLNASSVNEIMIVPQGPLAGLPFEALVNPERAPQSSIAGPFPTRQTQRSLSRRCKGRRAQSVPSPRSSTRRSTSTPGRRPTSKRPASSSTRSVAASFLPGPGAPTACTS